MTTLRRIDSRWWLGLGLVLTAAKLWLSRGQGIYALGSAGHDDQLFIQLAEHLVRGEWLGPYHQLTLAKGPAYSLFIAACFAIGLPLFLAQHLLYAGACALFVRALRPAIVSAGWRCAIYALLLCNPMTYDAPSMGRVLRQHIYGPLALLIFAGLVALWFRRQSTVRRQLPWAILTGLALGAFYLTREEAVWIAPSVLLLAGAYIFGSWRDPGASWRRALGTLAVLGLTAMVPVFVVSLQNYRHYGWFGTCEFRSPAFQEAYGALMRVEVGPQLPLIAMTREARVAIAEASPAFAEVQRQFDGGIARGWAEASEFFTHVPPAQEQIGGGWLMWALRDAVRETDPTRNAAQTLAFYQRIADEVNHAVDTGRLPGGPRRHGFMPRWSADLSGPFWSTALEFSDYVFSFRNFSGRPPPSSGSPESLQQFRDLTRERLAPPEGELDVVGAKRYLLNLDKVNWLHATGRALRPVLLGLFLIAQTLAVLRLFQAAWRREWTYPLTLAAAAWGACAVSVLMHAMIQVSSFPVRTISSFAPIYPLLLVFIAAMFWDAALALSALLRRNTAAGTAPIPHDPPSTNIMPLDRWLPWLAGLVALAPFVIWHRHFAALFWFGDDLFLVDQMAAMGLLEWSTRVFSENFVPLFKLLWGGAVMLFDGSYGAMLWLMWLTHALNTAILGLLLARAGFSRLAMLTVLALFALTPANIETLGWSVQWSAVLATTFLLLGLATWQRASATGRTWRTHLLLAFFAAASACSFSRGVLTGPVLALAVMTTALGSRDVRHWLAALPGAVLCALPAILVALVISHSSSGNHQHMSGHWGAALEFGLGYFLFNPAYVLLGEPSVHPIALVALAAAKVSLLFAGLWLARGPVRTLLLLLLAYDLGNSVLLGIGRYHTGFFASLSSRYQYSALLATLPFFAVVLDALVLRLPVRRFRPALTAIVVAGLILFCVCGWPAALAGFTGWRGTDMRRLMAAPATNDPDAKVPTLDFMHIERAKALQRAYHLH